MPCWRKDTVNENGEETTGKEFKTKTWGLAKARSVCGSACQQRPPSSLA